MPNKLETELAKWPRDFLTCGVLVVSDIHACMTRCWRAGIDPSCSVRAEILADSHPKEKIGNEILCIARVGP